MGVALHGLVKKAVPGPAKTCWLSRTELSVPVPAAQSQPRYLDQM